MTHMGLMKFGYHACCTIISTKNNVTILTVGTLLVVIADILRLEKIVVEVVVVVVVLVLVLLLLRLLMRLWQEGYIPRQPSSKVACG